MIPVRENQYVEFKEESVVQTGKYCPRLSSIAIYPDQIGTNP